MRLIDVDSIKYTEYVNGDITVSKEKIDKMPTIEVEPVKQAHWTEDPFMQWQYCGLVHRHNCSNCKQTYTSVWDEKQYYCPICGAKIKECDNA